MKSTIDWRVLRKHFLASFVGAAALSILCWAFWFVVESSRGRISALAFKYDYILNTIAVGLWWCICAWMSLRSSHILHAFGVVTGLTWGTVFLVTVVNFIQGGDEVSEWLPIMIHGALVVPVVTMVSVLPFWYFGKRRNDWTARRTKYRLKIALITPFVLIGVYCATFSCYWFLSPSKVTMWQGKMMREVSFRTSIHRYWRPALWFVERVCKYENYEQGGDDYIFRKFLDSPNS